LKEDVPLRDRLGFSGMSHGAIRHCRLLFLAATGLVLMALLAWTKIPRLEDPALEPPNLSVTIPYPGASAEDVESQVVKPIEEELLGVEGVDFIESKAHPSYAEIAMRFEDGTAMDTVTETVRGKVLGKRKQLPPEVGDPSVARAKMSTYAASMVVMVAGHRSDEALTEAAKRLKDGLVAVPGVASVTLRGQSTRTILIKLDPVRLAEQHMSVADVVERIKLANVRIPGGEIPVGKLSTLLSVSHELKDALAVARITLGATADGRGGTRTVSLGDVAEVHDDVRPQGERMLHDGMPAVGLEVRFRAQENAVEVGERVRAQIALERARAGKEDKGILIRVAHDQPEWVRRSLASFLESLGIGMLLVMLVITLGMGWRAALVVVTVLPLAIAGAIVALYGSGMALEQVSIAGLIVALGLLVDDAVVVTESIQLMRDRGLGPLRASVLGTARVFWANNGTTAVACASFVPLFFMSGDAGSYVRGLPIAVVGALVTSLLVAQFLTPKIATLIVRQQTRAAPIGDDAPFDRNKDSAGSHSDEQNAVLRRIKAAYSRITPFVVRRPWAIVGGATALLVGSVCLLPAVGIQFFPKSDKPALFVGVELPRGTDEAITALKVAEVVAELHKDPVVRGTSAAIGAAYPIVFAGRAPHASSKDYGDVLVSLTSASTTAIATRLRQKLSAIPGAKITVDELYNGPPVTHPIVIRVQGDDYAKLGQYAGAIKERLRGAKGTLNVADSLSDSVPLAFVDIDADRALRFGVTPGQIGSTLRSVYGKDAVTMLRQAKDSIDVVVEGADTGSDALARVAEMPVFTGGGKSVPLLSVGDINLRRGFAELRRRDARHVVEVTADLDAGALASRVLAEVKPALDGMKWEAGYRYAIGGEQAETVKGFRHLSIAGVATLGLIFIVLVLMFGSLQRAALVLLAVPFALIGAIPGLYVTGNAFGFMAFLGLVALTGVYVNHKIYFVDRVHELVERGMEWRVAIHQAGIDRLRPVVLTALTAILGLIPLTLTGGAFWSAFGWVNIFGLVASIPLSLVLLPALLAISYRGAPVAVDESMLPTVMNDEPPTRVMYVIPGGRTSQPANSQVGSGERPIAYQRRAL
jgi:multidrug efflux pump subunit AcrB